MVPRLGVARLTRAIAAPDAPRAARVSTTMAAKKRRAQRPAVCPVRAAVSAFAPRAAAGRSSFVLFKQFIPSHSIVGLGGKADASLQVFASHHEQQQRRGQHHQAGHHGKAQVLHRDIGEIEAQGPVGFILQNIIGCSMAFHASMKPRVAALRMAGRPSGSPTEKKQRRGPAPSSAAASNRLWGTASNPF